MGEYIELLIKIQDQIIKARRLAAELGDGLACSILLTRPRRRRVTSTIKASSCWHEAELLMASPDVRF